MPRAQFQTDYSAMRNTATGEPLAEFTIGTYRKGLNQLARAGYTTKDDLMKNQSKVIELVKALPTNAKQRITMSAIFKVINDEPLANKREYYDYFQTLKLYIRPQK